MGLLQRLLLLLYGFQVHVILINREILRHVFALGNQEVWGVTQHVYDTTELVVLGHPGKEKESE